MQICGYDNYRLNTYATYLHLLLSQVRFTIIDCIFFPAFHIIYDIKNFFEKNGIYMDYWNDTVLNKFYILLKDSICIDFLSRF